MCWLKTAQTDYLIVLEVRNMTCVSLGYSEGTGRAVFLLEALACFLAFACSFALLDASSIFKANRIASSDFSLTLTPASIITSPSLTLLLVSFSY